MIAALIVERRLCLMVTFLVLGFASCGNPRAFDAKRYAQAVKSGFKKIPEAMQIERLFGEADHFISYSGPEVSQDWNTVAFFGGRYILTMQVEIETNASFSEVTNVLGEPKFYLWEIGQVIVSPRGGVEGKFAGSWTFGLKEWKKVVEAGGDFSAVGIIIKKDQPVKSFDAYVKGQREPRVRVRPD